MRLTLTNEQSEYLATILKASKHPMAFDIFRVLKATTKKNNVDRNDFMEGDVHLIRMRGGEFPDIDRRIVGVGKWGWRLIHKPTNTFQDLKPDRRTNITRRFAIYIAKEFQKNMERSTGTKGKP